MDKNYLIYNYQHLKTELFLNLSDNHFKRIVKKKNEIKPWETLVISNNLSWEDFSKVNNHLYDLNGVKPVISISREYPYKEYYTHVLCILYACYRHVIDNVPQSTVGSPKRKNQDPGSFSQDSPQFLFKLGTQFF